MEECDVCGVVVSENHSHLHMLTKDRPDMEHVEGVITLCMQCSLPLMALVEQMVAVEEMRRNTPLN